MPFSLGLGWLVTAPLLRPPRTITEVAESVLAGRRREAEGRGIAVESALTPAPITGDPRPVESLVDNGLRHNGPEGGSRW